MSNVIVADIHSAQEEFWRVSVDKSISFDAEANFAIQTLMNNDYAMKIAMSNRQSVINAVTNIAAIGISLNPARKQAYLVPRDGKICLDISYMGLMDLAMQSGSIRWAQCAVVYSADEFELNGLDKQPIHKFKPFNTDRGEVVGVYCVIKTCDGDFLTHTMDIQSVFDIRDRSSAWKAWISKKARCPWVTDEVEMIRKTCIKQAYKYWPKGEKSDRLENAIHYMNEQAGEGLEKEQPKGLKILPTDGAMESLSIEVQQYLRELAAECTDMFKEHDIDKLYDRIELEGLEDMQKVAFWKLLDSPIRTALTKERNARKEAATAIPG